MQAPAIRPGGTDPARDGDITLYTAPEAQSLTWFNHARRVIFVNGMDNSPADHAGSARALSLLQGCPVIGIYNRTDGFWADIGQCLADKLTLAGVQAGALMSFDAWAAATDRLYAAARTRAPGLDKRAFVASLIASNRATHQLYALLAGTGGVNRAQTPIYCHSQGNLIASNALTAVALALGPQNLAGIEVNSFGSPCRYWPPRIARTNNAFTFDPVSWLDLRTDLTSSKIGFVAGHSFTLYMQNDAEFVVNRFRWGSFGMTASMDEAGLARFLVRIGNNAPRVRRIFERLRDAHWTDSDDVALAYVQEAPEPLLRQLKAADPGLITLLISLLEAGWTSGTERRAIDRLAAL